VPTEIEEIVRIDITQVLHAESFLGDRLYKSSAVAEMGDRLPLGTEVGLGPGNIVLDGDPAPPPLKGHSPQFSAHVHCGQTAGWTKMPLDMEVGRGPGDFVLDGDPAPPRKRAQPHPIFGPRLLWPNGWMDGTEVDLGPGHIALDGDPAPLQRGAAAAPLFSAHLLWPRSPISTTAELLFGSLAVH